MRSTIGIAFSSLLVLSGCVAFGPTIAGSGVTKVETREVAAFHGVDVSSAFEATIAIGTNQSVTLSVDDNLLPLVETEVKDGRLSVRYRGLEHHHQDAAEGRNRRANAGLDRCRWRGEGLRRCRRDEGDQDRGRRSLKRRCARALFRLRRCGRDWSGSGQPGRQGEAADT